MRIYLSHAIRGTAGPEASHDTQNVNCTAAILMGGKIMKEIPWVDLYIPAEHEDFVQKAYDSNYITEEHILDVDCQIIDECDAMICYVPDGDKLQGGRGIEFDHCIATGKPVTIFKKSSEAVEYLKALKEVTVPKG